MIVTQQNSFGAGEWSPKLDCRSDLEKYPEACRTLQNFIPLPGGGVTKRPGMSYRGTMPNSPADGRLVEFELRGSNSIILAIGGGKMTFYKDGDPITVAGTPINLSIPWADGTLKLLRWKQINDIMMFVHPNVSPKLLTRASDTSWTLENFVPGKNHPFLPDNTDETKRITASFKRNVDFTVWSSASVSYAVGDRVKRNDVYYNCEHAHTSSTSNKPEDAPTYYDSEEEENALIWTKEYVDESSTKGQTVTLTSNKNLWNANHVGSFWTLAHKRGLWQFEARLAVDSAATNTEVYSKVLIVQGAWTMTTFGNWNGKFHVQISRNRGKTWNSLRAVQSTAKTPRNATFEGNVPNRALLRLMFTGYGANGTSGSPYAVLNVEGLYLRGIVKITGYSNAKQVTAETITPILKDETHVWAEGAWSDDQGYPRCIEFHQNRVVLAATSKSPHTVWGSADDDYNKFTRGTLATDPFAHTIMIGQREPISWILSDRVLVIGSTVGTFLLYGADRDKPITPEDRNVERHSATGSHLKGPGILPCDSSGIFVQRGGNIVRELAFSYQSDRYESANLNLLADHLFPEDEVTDFALQRQPFTILWFIAGGNLFSLTYERAQNIAAWARHTTSGTVVSVACIAKPSEDEVWFIVDRDGTYTVERFTTADITDPADNGKWIDCWQTFSSPYSLTGSPLAGEHVEGVKDGSIVSTDSLDSGFFIDMSGSVTLGLPYDAKLMPMTPVLQLQNGSSRTREIRIHEVVVSLYKSRRGKIGQGPDATTWDEIRPDPDGQPFTGEKAIMFTARHDRTGDVCIRSDKPFPFFLRSLILKFNVHGDAG